MSFQSSFDPAAYTRVPALDLPALLTLARQVIAEAPSVPTASLRACQSELQATITRAEGDYRAQLSLAPEPLGRSIDPPADNAWSCIHRRLGAYADLPVELYPHAERARELQATLFPDGLRFTQLEYGAQYSESERRVQMLQAERGRLQSELCDLVGREFVDELLRTHAAYGELVGVTRRRPLLPRPDLRETRNGLMAALSAYLIQLVALYVSPGTSDKLRGELERSFASVDLYRDKAQSDRRRPEDPPAPPAPPILAPPAPAPA